jgi:RNA polymerase sigma factor (sigma-70 family)
LPKDDPRRLFELLALPHLDAAYNLARWLAGNAEDAEDVVQEAYLRAYRFFDGFRGDNIRGWLLIIVRNYFHTWAKENRSPRLGFVAEMPEPDSVEDERILWGAPQADPETLLLRDIDLATVRQVMQRLPSAYRKILLMREVEELSYHDIASITGLKIGTVAARLSRAREALRRLWHGAVAEDDVATPQRRHLADPHFGLKHDLDECIITSRETVRSFASSTQQPVHLGNRQTERSALAHDANRLDLEGNIARLSGCRQDTERNDPAGIVT